VDAVLALLDGDPFDTIGERSPDSPSRELRMHLHGEPRGADGIPLLARLVDGARHDPAVDPRPEQPADFVRRFLPPGQEFGRREVHPRPVGGLFSRIAGIHRLLEIAGGVGAVESRRDDEFLDREVGHHRSFLQAPS
jgi:hypothetical protein